MTGPDQNGEQPRDPWSSNASEWTQRGQTITPSRDTMLIDTPELVQIQFSVAGLGSRFLALLIDLLLQIVAYLLLFLLLILVLASGTARELGVAAGKMGLGANWILAILIFLHFLMYWGYFALFEGLWHGQTPGKRWMKLRVIKDSGRQITLFESLARNLVRVVDLLPGMYLVGCISILATRQNQRLGDLLADTLVVHERAEEAAPSSTSNRYITLGMNAATAPQTTARVVAYGPPADAVARFRHADLHLVETFFQRNLELRPDVRERLAEKLLCNLEARSGLNLHTDVSAERTLEALAMAMRDHPLH